MGEGDDAADLTIQSRGTVLGEERHSPKTRSKGHRCFIGRYGQGDPSWCLPKVLNVDWYHSKNTHPYFEITRVDSSIQCIVLVEDYASHLDGPEGNGKITSVLVDDQTPFTPHAR